MDLNVLSSGDLIIILNPAQAKEQFVQKPSDAMSCLSWYKEVPSRDKLRPGDERVYRISDILGEA